MRRPFLYALGWSGLWLGLVLVSFYSRPLMPVDETRYAGVAWEMWLRHGFFVPYLNGETYSHKPPLLFWLIQLGWWLSGVETWVARLVSPLFGLGSLFLTFLLARRLWPDDERTALAAPLVVLSSLGWTVFTTALMFDMLVAFFSLSGALGILHSWRKGGRLGWIILGISIGLGVLAKGPVILVYTLLPALLAPWWIDRPVNWKSWNLGILASIGLGAVIALSWALPAAWLGGQEYRDAILWGQTAGRMVDSFAHHRPWWWYLPLLPGLLFPWFIWPPFWRGLSKARLDAGLRFCLIWTLSGLLTFCLISGKQFHYLFPLFPAFGLLAARAMTAVKPGRLACWVPGLAFMLLGAVLTGVSLLETYHDLPDWMGETSPFWGLTLIGFGWLLGRRWLQSGEARALERLALSSIALVAILNLGILRDARPYYDLTPASRQIALLQEQNIPVVHVGKYHGQFQFIGRLERPIDMIDHDQVPHWAAEHPNGRLIWYSRSLDPLDHVEFHQPYRGRFLFILTSQAVLQNPVLLETFSKKAVAEPES